MKKILYVAESFGAGVYNALVNLLNGIVDEFEIVVLYAKREHTPENFEEDFDKRIKFIESKYMQRNIGIKDIKAFLEIKKIIKEEKPDIIHCHSSKAGFLGRMAANTKKIKTFYTPHGYSFLMQNCSKIKKKIFRMIEKIGVLNHSITIACSRSEYEETIKLTKRAVLVNNGVNLDKLIPYINKKKDIDINNLKVVTTGRISLQKNPELFNKIAENLKNIKFTWVGSGELENKLVSDNIEVTGWKNKEELLSILNDADIFILTSVGEGLSISLIEAMALGKICIVSNVIGNRDVILNGQNGFACNDLNDFLKAFQIIKENYFDLNQIIQNAYEDVLEKYNNKNMCEEYIKIYNS